MELIVALLQLLPTGTLEGNLEKGLSACRKARSMGADIALFPEMWSTGYQFPPQGDGPAIPKDHSFLQTFQGLARELSMAIGITYLEEFSPLPATVLPSLTSRAGECWIMPKYTPAILEKNVL